jgi:hypothetical protein
MSCGLGISVAIDRSLAFKPGAHGQLSDSDPAPHCLCESNATVQEVGVKRRRETSRFCTRSLVVALFSKSARL